MLKYDRSDAPVATEDARLQNYFELYCDYTGNMGIGFVASHTYDSCDFIQKSQVSAHTFFVIARNWSKGANVLATGSSISSDAIEDG